MIRNKSLCYNKLLFDQDKREAIYFQIEAEIWGHKQIWEMFSALQNTADATSLNSMYILYTIYTMYILTSYNQYTLKKLTFVYTHMQALISDLLP